MSIIPPWRARTGWEYTKRTGLAGVILVELLLYKATAVYCTYKSQRNPKTNARINQTETQKLFPAEIQVQHFTLSNKYLLEAINEI